ncbi:MAG: YafY family transcriptional regulator [Clostridia bacterium]|nr:YafY family transcriptional regulator [Clostridia bacterium]
MKFGILLGMLFDLLSKRKLTAAFFADKYEISVRTVYRYVDELSLRVPVYVKRGRDGGICLADNFKLPMGFMTEQEYASAIEALEMMYAQLPEERFWEAKQKLSAQCKAETRDLTIAGTEGTILVDSGTWGDTKKFSDKIRLIEQCIKERFAVEIEYRDRNASKSVRKIEPHVLVFKQGVWYVYAFCRKQRDFRLFRLGRIFTAFVTEERFNRRPFKREDIPLNFWVTEENSVEVKLQISREAFVAAQDWLGGENLFEKDGVWYAEVTLPDDESLVKKLVELGRGVKVLSPAPLAQKVKELALSVAKMYE